MGAAVLAASVLLSAAPAHALAIANLDVHWGFIPFGNFPGSGGTKGAVSIQPSGQADVVASDQISAGTKTISQTVDNFYNIVNSDPAVTGASVSLAGGYNFFLQGQGDATSTAAIDTTITSAQLGISAEGDCHTTASADFFLNHCALSGQDNAGWSNLTAPAPGGAITYEVSVKYDYTLNSDPLNRSPSPRIP